MKEVLLMRFPRELVYSSVLLLLAGIWSTEAIGQSDLAEGLDKRLVSQEQRAFQAAVEAAQRSVVQIETFGGLERVGDSLVADGPTTGTIVDADGWIVSSLYNFRQQPASILVTLPQGPRVPAIVAARDFSRELVLLKVDVEQALPKAELSPVAEQRVGMWSIALGKTFSSQNVSQSVGIISAMGRAYGKAVQTDAKVSPINYGGPLIDLQGRVIGILSPISPGAALESGDSSQLYDSGIGFAIPLADIQARLPRMKSGEDIYSGKLGIVPSDQNEFAGPVDIIGTSPGTPAAKAGLRVGDRIVSAGGKPVRILADLRNALGPVDAGQTLAMTVLREEEILTVESQLVKEIPVYRERFLGIRGRPTEEGGIRITEVQPGSPAARASLQTGWRIAAVDGKEITSIEQLQGRLAVAELASPLELLAVDEDGTQHRRTIQIEEWPENLPDSLPPLDQGVREDGEVKTVEINVGDFPNDAFALIPPGHEERTLGLLVIFPEPGEVDRQATLDFWGEFSAGQGWIIAVIGSRNPRGWTREELELAGRAMGRLDQAYEIDPLRSAFAGIGVGGKMALMAAGMERKRVRGVATLGTQIGQIALRAPNAPLQSLQFLLAGPADDLTEVAEQLSEFGYAVNLLDSPEMNTGQWSSLPAKQLQLWLEGLGRL